MESSEIRFLADSMLGRLAKWLRVMGYDTHYQQFYQGGAIENLLHHGRLLLTRHKPTLDKYPDSLLIFSDKVQGQLKEVKERGYLIEDQSKWFSRCLICNTPLEEAHVEDAPKDIPEYILHQNITVLSFCNLCGRYYWPGSHRNRMIIQLEGWGFKYA